MGVRCGRPLADGGEGGQRRPRAAHPGSRGRVAPQPHAAVPGEAAKPVTGGAGEGANDARRSGRPAEGRALSAIIYFVRHGETDWNREARLQGQRDIDLNATGRVQAEEAGRRFSALLPDPASLDYVASPLRRTRDTME